MAKGKIIQSVERGALGALTNTEGRIEAPYTREATFQNPMNIISDKMKNSVVLEPPFTGIARSLVCVKNQGFNNYQVCTLYIEKGKVIRMDKSDMWQSFEAFSFLETVSKISCDHLNSNFEDGKAFER